MSLTIAFELEISNADRAGEARSITKVQEDVPAGADPRQYLLDRILKEFGITRQQEAAAAETPAAEVNTGKVENA